MLDSHLVEPILASFICYFIISLCSGLHGRHFLFFLPMFRQCIFVSLAHLLNFTLGTTESIASKFSFNRPINFISNSRLRSLGKMLLKIGQIRFDLNATTFHALHITQLL